MKCTLTQNKSFCRTLAAIGLISMVFGYVWNMGLPGDAHSLSTLAGMLSGAGTALALLGVIWLIRLRLVSPEKLKLERIEKNDERSVYIRGIGSSVATVAATLLFAVLAFLLLWLDYRIPAFMCIGAMYLHISVFFIAMRVASKRV